MNTYSLHSRLAHGVSTLAIALVVSAGSAAAQTESASAPAAATVEDIRRLERELARQGEQLSYQADLIVRQQIELGRQQRAMDAQRVTIQGFALQAENLSMLRGTGPQPQTAAPAGPVGEAPPEPEVRVDAASLPEGSGVLTGRGRLTLDPSIDYTHTTSNRLVFRGIELVPGVQLGAIDASDTDRSATVATLAARYGLTSRIELEVRAPYMHRADRINVVQQRDQTVTREILLSKSRLADIEFTGRYQINRARPGRPIFVANLRVKSDTGSSPYEIARDQFGIATALSTGSGFWGVEPSVSLLFPTDPVVIYGSVGYFAHLGRNVDKVIGDVRVGKVNPGDSLAAGVGFGIAMNERFSFSLGFKMNYIYQSSTMLGSTVQWSKPLQVGSFQFGASYVLSPRQVLSAAFEMGATADAPDVRFIIRAPYRF